MARQELVLGIQQVSVMEPKSFNAISSGSITTLVDDFEVVCGLPETRVIILRSAEVPGVCLSPWGGADVKGLVDTSTWKPISAASAREHMMEGIEAVDKIRTLCTREGNDAGRIVVIGWVDGVCVAGGVEFVYGISDLVYATPRSTFGMREILLAILGGWNGPKILRQLLGSPLWVKEMFLALGPLKGGDILAETALTRGMLNGIFSEDEIEARVLLLARGVLKRDPMAVTDNLLLAELALDDDYTSTATDLMVKLMDRNPFVKAVKAFLQSSK